MELSTKQVSLQIAGWQHLTHGSWKWMLVQTYWFVFASNSNSCTWVRQWVYHRCRCIAVRCMVKRVPNAVWPEIHTAPGTELSALDTSPQLRGQDLHSDTKTWVFFCTFQPICRSGNILTFRAFILPSAVWPPHIIPQVLISQAVQTLPLNMHIVPHIPILYIHQTPESIYAVFKYNLPPTSLPPQDRRSTQACKVYTSFHPVVWIPCTAMILRHFLFGKCGHGDSYFDSSNSSMGGNITHKKHRWLHRYYIYIYIMLCSVIVLCIIIHDQQSHHQDCSNHPRCQ